VRANKAPLSCKENICSRPHQSQALRTFASVAATAIYTTLDNARSPDDLDHIARKMWRDYGDGAISDEDATFLGTCIDRQRPRTRATKPMGKVIGGLARRFRPRGRQGSPDRQASRERRRMLGGSAVLPPQLRCTYTEGQRSVLTIIAGEVKHHGICDLPIDKIAALAGVCRTTVQTTLHEARRLFHIKVTERPQWGRKSLTNIVQIISDEWLMWLKRGPTAHRPIGSKSPNLVSATKIIDIKDDGVERTWPQAAAAGGAARGCPKGTLGAVGATRLAQVAALWHVTPTTSSNTGVD